ncbi:MAG: tripartite tricarboxylate transporter substrate binding protein [Burkholderiales bacterium]|nr:tripartite tricarboxylate transporter substrate binding protein [Burkholderiales bacterium]
MLPAIGAALAFLVAPGTGSTQTTGTSAYPVKPVRIIVGFPAGGASDSMARMVGQKLAESWGQSMVMDNRPGAGGVLALEVFANAAPDGYTLSMATPGMLTIAPLLERKPSYDPLKSFAPISVLIMANQLFSATMSLPAGTVKELIALAKARPGTINYASSGFGTTPHLTGELFNLLAGVKMVHVPYKGSGPALTDLISGQVQVGFGPVLAGLPHVKAGRIKALAVTGTRRSVNAPDIPTVIEAGVPKFDMMTWTGILAPARTPPGIVARIGAEVQRIMHQPDTRAFLVNRGVEPVGSTSEEFASLIRSEMQKWRDLLQRTGLKLRTTG